MMEDQLRSLSHMSAIGIATLEQIQNTEIQLFRTNILKEMNVNDERMKYQQAFKNIQNCCNEHIRMYRDSRSSRMLPTLSAKKIEEFRALDEWELFSYDNNLEDMKRFEKYVAEWRAVRFTNKGRTILPFRVEGC